MQPGLGGTDLDVPSRGQSLLSELQNRPTRAGHGVGMGGERVGRLRGGAHSLDGATDPAQMGQLRNSPRQARRKRVLGTWVHSFQTAALAGPGQPAWLGIRRPCSRLGPATHQLLVMMVTQAWQSGEMGSVCLGSLPASWHCSAASSLQLSPPNASGEAL